MTMAILTHNVAYSLFDGCGHSCSSAATTYIASTGRTAPFIVIETET